VRASFLGKAQESWYCLRSPQDPLALLRHLLRLAHEEWEAIDNVPRIRLEKEPQGRLRWLTQEEITQLLDACAKSKNKELRAVVIGALNTAGLRRGELLELRWGFAACSMPSFAP
jgi:integrase